MKKIIIAAFILAAFFTIPLNVCGAEGKREASAPRNAGVIRGHYAAPRDGYAAGDIPKADLEAIVQAAVQAPSASNRQPWFFTVVQSLDLAKKIVPQTVEGNVIIVISTDGTTEREILDCGLATQSIYLAAQALGYGSRIHTGPIDNLNENLKGELGFPENRKAVALVRIGRLAENVDAASAASARKSAGETVTYK